MVAVPFTVTAKSLVAGRFPAVSSSASLYVIDKAVPSTETVRITGVELIASISEAFEASPAALSTSSVERALVSVVSAEALPTSSVEISAALDVIEASKVLSAEALSASSVERALVSVVSAASLY